MTGAVSWQPGCPAAAHVGLGTEGVLVPGVGLAGYMYQSGAGSVVLAGISRVSPGVPQGLQPTHPNPYCQVSAMFCSIWLKA